MSMQNVQNVVDNTTNFFDNLPQYAALITASIAIILFLLKEFFEMRRRSKNKKNEIESLNAIMYEEIKLNSRYMRDVLAFFADIKNKKVFKLSKDIVLNQILIEYIDDNGNEKFFVAVRHSSRLIENYLLDVSRVNQKLAIDLVYLNAYIKHYNDTILLGIDEFTTAKPNTDAILNMVERNDDFMVVYTVLCNSVLIKCNERDEEPFQI
ncbi:hypothetical protein [Morganella morganii]|uniref:hypothetical protein n=2 Tax=Morganella morganii TaxID=582 RepID=UPI003EBEBA41